MSGLMDGWAVGNLPTSQHVYSNVNRRLDTALHKGVLYFPAAAMHSLPIV